MATNDQHLQLTDEQVRSLSELSLRSGKPAQELLAQALGECQSQILLPDNGHKGESLLDRLSRSGLLGCLPGGPADLSTNPDYMQGFGE